jgi:hypothetical protein
MPLTLWHNLNIRVSGSLLISRHTLGTSRRKKIPIREVVIITA